MEALAKEIAAFGVGVTIVEPDGVSTGFRDSAVIAASLGAYDGTPAAAVRGLATSSRPSPGDPARVAAAIAAAATTEPAPLRVVLGSDSFQFVHSAVTERLAEFSAQRDLAASTDRTQEH